MRDEQNFRGYVVLVVEDNPDILEATTYLIEAAFGCTVLTASSCMEALARLDAGVRVDLIFSEAVLPGKDGLTLARLARERQADLPVVLATAWADEIDAILDRGYIALLKPYSVQRLEAVFTELLRRSPKTTESDATLPSMGAPTNPSRREESRQLRSRS